MVALFGFERKSLRLCVFGLYETADDAWEATKMLPHWLQYVVHSAPTIGQANVRHIPELEPAKS